MKKYKRNFKAFGFLLAPFATVCIVLGMILTYLSDGEYFLMGGLWINISRFVPGAQPLQIEHINKYDMSIVSLYLLVSFIVLLLIILGKFLEIKYCSRDKSNVNESNISISE